MAVNIEIKARCLDHERIREILKAEGAIYHGTDHQVDTYFSINSGRLKLREGSIENNLIFYDREDKNGPKVSNYVLHNTSHDTTLKEVLTRSLGISVIVDKQREIYFINNVKFHIDTVKDLGTFVEIEAIDKDGSIGSKNLMAQCTHYLTLFDIKEHDLLTNSYSDMLAQTSF